MPKIEPQPALPSADVSARMQWLTTRLTALENEQGSIRDWRYLLLDITCVYLRGQRGFLELHSRILAALKTDSEVRQTLCDESSCLVATLSGLCDLMRAVGMRIDELETRARHDPAG